MKKITSKLSFKQIVYCILILIGCIFTIKANNIDKQIRELTHSETNFRPGHVFSKFEHRPEWDVPISKELLTFVNIITQQPFYWLGKGHQIYAFGSQDGGYVLKFFQQQRLREINYKTHPIQLIFSKKFRDQVHNTNIHKEEIFFSSKICFEEIPEETGIIFIHLNRTNNLLKGIRVCDHMGQTHKIRPDRSSFIIQRKATYIFPTITEHMENNDLKGAKARIDQIFSLLTTLAKKGIVDSDYALIRNNNMGFTKNRAVYIDIGHLTKRQNLNVLEHMKYECKIRLKPLQDWLMISYPVLYSYYQEKKEELLVSLGAEPSTKEELNQEQAIATFCNTMK